MSKLLDFAFIRFWVEMMVKNKNYCVITAAILAILLMVGARSSLQAASINPESPSKSESKAYSKGTSAPGSRNFSVNIDKSVSPAKDFYHYANGTWLKNTPIPNEYDKWGVLNVINDRNLTLVRNLLEDAAKKTAKLGSIEQKIGDFYKVGMDTKKLEEDDVKPLADEFKRIDNMKTLDDLRSELARLHSFGVNSLFSFSSGQDFKDATKVIGQAGQSGLGLPEKDYYFNQAERFKKIRIEYVNHVARMLGLLGIEATDAKTRAQKIMEIETQLADASMPNIDLRDPEKIYHKMNLKELAEMTPRFSWSKYFSEIGCPGINEVNVGQPDFFKKLDHQIAAFSMDQWKDYLRWHLIDAAAPYLSHRFVDADFDFHGKVLTGKKENLPRWKRIVNSTNHAIGEAVGQQYVKTAFTPDAKAKALKLVTRLREVLREDLGVLDWMDDTTRKNAIAKLDSFVAKIGYPDKWRDYSGLKVNRESYVWNVIRAEQFEFNRNLAKIGKPVDRTEWLMTPQTVNAYYWSEMNEIVFPAGILQPTIFDPKADDATNLGAMGMVIGHEMTHGFDDSGSKFDAQGNMKNWWSADVEKHFKERIALIESQYDGYTVDGDTHLKGKLVAGEAAADLGGLTIAYKALEKILADKPRTADAEGFTPEQRFFLSFAQAWATNVRPEKEHMMAATDPHPIPKYRVNGTLANMDAFEKAFDIKGDNTMMLPKNKRCYLW
ncbi:MAG: M13 family metallopeptidase [Candidatus Melainabacteria bacterium]|nr:M13 family metallopeptidase [Candidatus Melainabacteria bacterium]